MNIPELKKYEVDIDNHKIYLYDLKANKNS